MKRVLYINGYKIVFKKQCRPVKRGGIVQDTDVCDQAGCNMNKLCLTGTAELSPHLTVSIDDKLGGGQVLQSHGAEGVQLGGGDADLGPQAKLVAVGEAC